MAIIRSLSYVETSGSPHPTEVDAEWSVVRTGDRLLLQLSTFGSDGRASQPKVSQTIQIDRATATELSKAFASVFADS